VAELTRRVFIKTGLLGLSSLALGPAPFPGGRASALDIAPQDYVSLFTGRVVTGVPTTCGLCPAGCGIRVFVEEGRIAGLAGNPEHPLNRGALCALGSAGMNLADSPGRIRKPLRRDGKRGEGHWREIEWQDALREFASMLRGNRPGQTPGALAVAAPRRELSPFLNRLVAAFPGAVLAESDGYELPVEREAGRFFGGGYESAPDLARARLVLNFGANPLGSPRQLVSWAQWRGGERGAGPTWITLDPRLSETANRSQEWVPLRPGSDRALALALARVMLESGWEDRAFLSRATDLEPEALLGALRDWTPDRAAELCGLPVSAVLRLAERFGTTNPAVAIYGSGVTARAGGAQTVRAVLLLNLLKGNLGSRGGWRLYRPVRWRQPDLPDAAAEAEVAGGSLFHGIGRGLRRIGGLLSVHADPAATDPAGEATAAILRNPEQVPFHVALACAWNETARLADLVLPAATPFESWGLRWGYCPSEDACWLGLRQPALSAPPGVRSPEEALLETALLLGGKPREMLSFRSAEDYYRSLVAASFPDGREIFGRLQASGFHVFGREEGRISERDRHEPGGASRRAGKGGEGGRQVGFSTAALKGEGAEDADRVGAAAVRIPVSRMLGETGSLEAGPAAGRKAQDPARTLILFASATQGDDAGHCKWLEEIDHASPVWINPLAARELGIREGDWVTLTGPAGSIRTRARLTEGIHPEAVAIQARPADRGLGLLALPKAAGQGEPDLSLVWWSKEVYGENPRRLVPWPEDPSREAPGWKDTRVILKRA